MKKSNVTIEQAQVINSDRPTADKPKRKPFTKAQLKAMKKKREANPQPAHLTSAVMKKDLADFKRNGKANLIKCMDAMSRVDEGQNMYENELFIKECKKAINYLAKKQLTLVLKAVRTNKNGTYSPYYFAQLVQKVVRLKMTKDMTYIQALKSIIESK